MIDLEIVNRSEGEIVPKNKISVTGNYVYFRFTSDILDMILHLKIDDRGKVITASINTNLDREKFPNL